MKWILVTALLAWETFGYGQTESDQLEFLQQQQTEDIDYQQLFEQMEGYRNRPLNLNTCNQDKLSSLVFLDALQVAALIKYRDTYGSFADWQELLRIDGFDSDVIDRLKIYCSLQATDVRSKLITDFITNGKFEQTVRVSSSLKKAVGYLPSDPAVFPVYPGSQLKTYTRSRYSLPGRFSFGLLTEKDPGEKLFTKSHPISPDFVTAHAFIQPEGKVIKQLAIGDFNFSSGLGLVFNPGFGMFKSAQITQVYKPFSGLRPYSSVNEGSFFRGIGTTLAYRRLRGTVFYSHKEIDATIDQETGTISSTYNTGLHRTTGELKRRKAALEQVIGVSIHQNLGKLLLGISFQASKVKPSGINSWVSPALVGGANAHYQYSKGMAFGEVAMDKNANAALLCGSLNTITNSLSSMVIYRNYPSQFTNSYGGAFSNSGKLENEKGIFLGLDFQFNQRNKFSGYVDQYTYPQASFYTNYSANQRDGILQWTYTKKRKFQVYVRGRWQFLQRDQPEDRLLKAYSSVKSGYRLNAEYTFFKVLTVKQRWETSNYSTGNLGWLVYQDVIYKPLEKGIHFTGRIAVFKMDTYDNRIYAYENDVLFSYSIPAYFNTGTRYYLMVSGPITRNIDYWIRYSNWVYRGVETVGSGNDEIPGNKKPQLEVQLRLTIK